MIRMTLLSKKEFVEPGTDKLLVLILMAIVLYRFWVLEMCREALDQSQIRIFVLDLSSKDTIEVAIKQSL